MTSQLQERFGDSEARVEAAIASLAGGRGILVTDDGDRENEGDLIFAAESLTVPQMAMLIRECSGIVCLCLTPEKIASLELPLMTRNNTSRYSTAFTVSIEAAEGVTTGVSAADRVRTVHAASAPGARLPARAAHGTKARAGRRRISRPAGAPRHRPRGR